MIVWRKVKACRCSDRGYLGFICSFSAAHFPSTQKRTSLDWTLPRISRLVRISRWLESESTWWSLPQPSDTLCFSSVTLSECSGFKGVVCFRFALHSCNFVLNAIVLEDLGECACIRESVPHMTSISHDGRAGTNVPSDWPRDRWRRDICANANLLWYIVASTV